MITLAIYQRMLADGVADLTENKDFFWEEMPLQQNGKPASGVWIVTRGGDASNSPKKLNLKTTVDFYVAFKEKVKTEVVQQQILEWLIANRSICDLSGSVDGTTYSYAFSNVRITPTSTPENDGTTENGLIVKLASALLVYDTN